MTTATIAGLIQSRVKGGKAMQVFFGIAYFIVGLVQLFAIMDGVAFALNINKFFATMGPPTRGFSSASSASAFVLFVDLVVLPCREPRPDR